MGRDEGSCLAPAAALQELVDLRKYRTDRPRGFRISGISGFRVGGLKAQTLKPKPKVFVFSIIVYWCFSHSRVCRIYKCVQKVELKSPCGF